MSRVDFYILSASLGVDRFACSIANKAWAAGNRVHIHTGSEQMAASIDNLLWTFRDISFVPHVIYDERSDDETPVTIGYGNDYPGPARVMINLDTDIPEFAGRFDRIIEIVGGDNTDKQAARKRYRGYQRQDYELHDHKIDKPGDYD